MTNSHPIPWTTGQILEATGGELVCGRLQQSFARVFIDSRKPAADGIFIAIIGEVHDGHTFASDVVAQGVRGLVIGRREADHLPIAQWKQRGVTAVAVQDTTRALGDMAAFNRRRAAASVVAITGSNGKTTTQPKETNSPAVALAKVGNQEEITLLPALGNAKKNHTTKNTGNLFDSSMLHNK